MRSRPFPLLTVGVGLLAAVVVFFPSLFFGRVISPLDTVLTRPPWQATHHAVEVTNPELETAATTFVPRLLEARRSGLSTAVWSPHRACGGPGTMALSGGLLSPLVGPLVPWLAEANLLNGIVLGKLLLAFAGSLALQRRLGRSEAAAAVGAVAFALAGPLTARWLEPASATAAALPLLLWAVDRCVGSTGPLCALPVATVAWLVLLTGGDSEGAAVAVTATAAWALFRAASGGPFPSLGLRGLAAALVALLLALLILAPALALDRDTFDRASAAPDPQARGWGLWVPRLLVDPMAWGDPRQDTFEPPRDVGATTFAACCLTPGMVALGLALVGAAWRWPGRLLWVGGAALPLAAIAWTPLSRLVESLPGVSSATALAPLAALALSTLAAAGCDRLLPFAPGRTGRVLASSLAAAVVLEQGLLAGHMLAFLPPKAATLRPTPALDLVRSRLASRPDRTAPLQDVLWPDTAAALRLDDVRTRGRVQDPYRRWLETFDPQVWGHFGTVLRLNAPTLDVGHPYLHALGARFLMEPPGLRVLEYTLGRAAVEVEGEPDRVGPLSGGEVVQELGLPAGCSRLGLLASSGDTEPEGSLEASLVDEVSAREVGRWTLDARTLAAEGLAWLDLPVLDPDRRHQLLLQPRLSSGELWLRCVRSTGALSGRLLSGGVEQPLDLALLFDQSGMCLLSDGPDLRLWEHRRALPRFWAVHGVIPGGLDEVLAASPPLPLDRVAVVDAATFDALDLGVPPAGARERVRLLGWTPSSYRLDVDLAAPALLASSIPHRPDLWRASLDGRPARTVLVNGMFIGLPLPAGSHSVRLDARLPPLWYGCSLVGAVVAGYLVFAGRRRRGPRGGEATGA